LVTLLLRSCYSAVWFCYVSVGRWTASSDALRCRSLGGDLSMNFVISAVVGGLVATAVTFGGVQAIQGAYQKPVKAETLFEYSDD
jgi:hypothetical protein